MKNVCQIPSPKWALFLLSLGMGGCVEWTIETTLNPDGSGVREEKMEVTENGDYTLPPREFEELMLAPENHGWSQQNILSDGGTSYTFRESFIWDNGFDAIVEFLMEDFDRSLRARYPTLSTFDRGGIVGFARAGLWAAVDKGLLEGEDEDPLLEEVVDRTTEHGAKIVQARIPGADPEIIREVLSQVVSGETDKLEEFFDETVPGMNLGLNTNIVFRLNMPGQVTNSNAHSVEGTTLVWEFGPMDALATPVEIYAESAVGGSISSAPDPRESSAQAQGG